MANEGRHGVCLPRQQAYAVTVAIDETVGMIRQRIWGPVAALGILARTMGIESLLIAARRWQTLIATIDPTLG